MIRFPEAFRVRTGPMASEPGGSGAFMFKPITGERIAVLASMEGGWEHVSVSLADRLPNWDEMCQVKDLFWEPEDAVVQYHPPKSRYVNCHPFCLHMWRPTDASLPLPPDWMVGPRTT